MNDSNNTAHDLNGLICTHANVTHPTNKGQTPAETINMIEDQINAIAASAPSISTAAMLVDLGIGTWTATKKDKSASNELAANKNAERGRARVNKDLISCPELDAVKKFTQNVLREAHKAATMQWSDSGLRLLPTKNYFTYNHEMTGLMQDREKLVTAFLDVYDDTIVHQQLVLGDLFDSEDYPTRYDVSRKFYVRLNYMPLPDHGDFRLDIGQQANAELNEKYKQLYFDTIHTAMDDAWHRLHAALSTVVRQLGVNEQGKPNRVFDGSFDALHDIINMLDGFNLTGDSQMTAIKQRLEDAMYGISADNMRGDTQIRADKKDELEQIMASLPSLDI